MKEFKWFKSFLNLAVTCFFIHIIVVSCNYNTSSNYIKACENGDFEKAHVVLEKIRNYYTTKGLAAKRMRGVSSIKGYQAYVDADIYIFREEVAYLMSTNNAGAENRIIKLIMETPLDGKQLDAGKYDYIEDKYAGTNEWNKHKTLIWLYYNCRKRYNQKCSIVLELSILNGNKSLASRVLSYYKQTMHIDQENYIVNNVFYDYEDRDAAQKRLDEAVNNGFF